jgi:hypothetical protein
VTVVEDMIEVGCFLNCSDGLELLDSMEISTILSNPGKMRPISVLVFQAFLQSQFPLLAYSIASVPVVRIEESEVVPLSFTYSITPYNRSARGHMGETWGEPRCGVNKSVEPTTDVAL